MYKKIIKTLFIFIFVFSSFAGFTFAQETETELDSITTKIEALKLEYKDLKNQVETGEITKDDAREIWQAKIDQIRANKDEFFKKGIDTLRQRYQRVLKQNPERAEKVNKYIDSLHEERRKMTQTRLELTKKLKEGEITKDDAHEMRKQISTSFKNVSRGVREELKLENTTRRENFQEQRDQVLRENKSRDNIGTQKRDNIDR